MYKRQVRIGLNAKKHRRNLNTLVCGGSGAGKTRFYCKPNLMQCNTSFVILDPKGEILRDTGRLLEKKGYEVRVLDLISMEKSHCYNPFVYLQSDNDVQKLVTNLFKSTTPKGSQSNDPFWDTAASMLLLALVFYLHYEAPPEEQNFAMVKMCIRDRFRLVADRICEKYGLYYNPKPNRSKQSSYYYKKEKAGMPTRYTMAREAIDKAISHSTNLAAMKYALKEMGCELQVSESRKYWTIIIKGYDKPIRLSLIHISTT